MLKIEMHCHTKYSHDGFITESNLIKYCRKKNIDCVCITDHNTFQGVLKLAEQTHIRIIPGEEIKTQSGEITGLFLKEEIPAGLTLEQTVQRIKEQEGLVYLPHPFDKFRDSAVKIKDIEKIRDKIDIIEIFNSRTFNTTYNAMALEFAKRNNIVVAVGSDAHHQFELANSYMQIDDFDDMESFLGSLKKATYIVKKCPFILRLHIKALKILTGKD